MEKRLRMELLLSSGKKLRIKIFGFVIIFVPGFEFPDVDSYDYCNAAQKLELERLAGLYNTADGKSG